MSPLQSVDELLHNPWQKCFNATTLNIILKGKKHFKEAAF